MCLAASTRNPETPGEEAFPAKVTGIPCAAGDVIRIQAPNGAGYGDPLERDPAQVVEDVLDGFTTVEIADRVLVLDAGRIIEDGPPRELISDGGTYAGLHQAWLDSLV